MKTIGLCMIVKNEAHVIRRCLDSVKPLIDYLLIVDTGSTDNTKGVIGDWWESNLNIYGQILDDEWIDFATNRTQAIEWAKMNPSDYIFMIDADEVLEFIGPSDKFPIQWNDEYIKIFKQNLTADLYDIPMRCGASDYTRPQLFKNDGSFYFRGVLHEFLERKIPITSRGMLGGLRINAIQDGARSQAGIVAKYAADAQVLTEALESETDPLLKSRYTFYLAQSLKEINQPDHAIAQYLQRANMGGWSEEIYWSLYQAAILREEMKPECAPAQIIQKYLQAFEINPMRAEAVYGAVKSCRLSERYHQAYLLAKHALGLSAPSSALFSQRWIYDYGILFEFSIVAYYAGHYQDSLNACDRLLIEKKCPVNYLEQTKQNRAFAAEKLGLIWANQPGVMSE